MTICLYISIFYCRVRKELEVEFAQEIEKAKKELQIQNRAALEANQHVSHKIFFTEIGSQQLNLIILVEKQPLAFNANFHSFKVVKKVKLKLTKAETERDQNQKEVRRLISELEIKNVRYMAIEKEKKRLEAMIKSVNDQADQKLYGKLHPVLFSQNY